jgi:putative flavoprotein involved in K+ transport
VSTSVDLEGTSVPVVVVGAGQAGLSVSRLLALAKVEHLVLEARTAFSDWKRRRWDSFCLVTPNWQCQLPGWPYSGPDPDGFMALQELVGYLDGFAAATSPPLVEGVTVQALRRAGAATGGPARYELTTSAGQVHADHVVVATGPYADPVVPALAAAFPTDLTQVHSGDYRNPDALPGGAVLVVGTGQSGCQIAEDLHRAGRRVHLATGSAPRVARRYRGRDVVRWLDDLGYYATTIADHPHADDKRRNVNHYVSGRDGGHDIDLRAFALEGMQLHGHLTAVEGTTVDFADDLAANLDGADRVAEEIKDTIDGWIERSGTVAPPEPRYVPPWRPAPGPTRIDLVDEGVSTVLWCTGFRPDHSWIDLPVFDAAGRPAHQRGVTAEAGVYFLGLPWQHTWGSARLSGIAVDAAHVADVVVARLTGAAVPGEVLAAPVPAGTS